MAKIVVFQLEDVILNEDLLNLKYFEILWFYLRRYSPDWSDFRKIIETHEIMLRKKEDLNSYLSIAKQHLNERDYANFIDELNHFTKRYYSKYVHPVPAMNYVLHTARRSNKVCLLVEQKSHLEWAKRIFNLKDFFWEIMVAHPQRSLLFLLDNFLKEKQLHPGEVTLVSNRIQQAVVPATSLGIFSIVPIYEAKTKGFLPQQYSERIFFESLTRLNEYQKKKIKKSRLHCTVVSNPAGILEEIDKQHTAVGAPATPAAKQEEEIDIWQILKEAFLPSFEEPENSPPARKPPQKPQQ